MKKVIVCVLLSVFYLSALAQDFPYGKLLNYKNTDFKNAKFTYNSYYNQWSLVKRNGWQVAGNIISALVDESADVRPAENDYQIIAQMGKNEQIAWLKVVFYQNSTYHDILTFAADKGSNNLETNSGSLTKTQFDYEAFSFSIVRNLKEVKTTSTNTYAAAKTKDESYNEYVYTIYTGVQAESQYLDKQAAKQQKRDEKGKKQNNVDNFY